MKIINKKTSIQLIAEAIATKNLENLIVGPGLIMSKDYYFNREVAHAEEILFKKDQQNENLINQAKDLIHKELKNLPKEEKDLYQQDLLQAILNTNVDVGEVLELGSWQKALKLSDNTLNWIYKTGYSFFKEKKYEQAWPIFFILTLLNPMIYEYWVALGFMQRLLSQAKESIHSFNMASLLKDDEACPKQQIMEIYCELKEWEKASSELSKLEKITGEQPEIRKELEFLRNK